MATQVPVTARIPGGTIKSKAVLSMWLEREPDSVTFVSTEKSEELHPDKLPSGAQLSVKDGGSTVATVTKNGNGMKVS